MNYLKEREEVIKFLAGSPPVEEDAASLEKSCYKTDTEEVIWHIKRIDTTWDRRSAYVVLSACFS